MNNKFIKIITLLVLFFFLTGCGSWEDIQNNYGELLKDGVKCTYNPNGENGDSLGINELILSADYDGAYVQINGGSKQTLLNTSSTNNLISFEEGFSIQFTDGAIKGYLQKYATNNRCPNNIYINSEAGINNFMVEDCADYGGYCNSYNWKSNSENNSSSCTTASGCNYNCAIDCTHIFKTNSNVCGNAVDLEFGYYKAADGSKEKYFAINDNGTIYTSTEDEDFIINTYLVNYEILSSSVNKIWTTDGFITKDNLKLSSNVFNDKTTVYISDSENKDDPGAYKCTDKIELKASSSFPKQDTLIRLNYNNLCQEEGVKNAVLIIGKIVTILLYFVPILLIVLGTIDFLKAEISNDENSIGKATQTLIKRIVAGVIVFLMYIIILSLLNALHITDKKYLENGEEYNTCLNCLLYPFNDCNKPEQKLK